MSRTKPPEAVRSILYIHRRLGIIQATIHRIFLVTNVTKKLDHNKLLLKEVLRRNHSALLYENIDNVKDLHSEDNQTVGYKTAIQRVKRLCGINLQQYESYLDELGSVRNKIQHFKYSINGEYHKELMTRTFSAIEFLFRDILGLRFEDYETIIDLAYIEFLHEDISVNKARKADIVKEFKKGQATKFRLEYTEGKFIDVTCPVCGTESLAIDNIIKCKFCGAEFDDYVDIHNSDDNCITSRNILREFGRRRHLIRSNIFECPECENNTIIEMPNREWQCLVCGFNVSDSICCDECGEWMPHSKRVYQIAISDTDTNDFKYLCPSCAKMYKEDENFIGYEIN